jgi:hypothetical protein
VRHGERASDEARDLTPAERDLLDAMLDVEGLIDAKSLRLQAAAARASSSCACGCGSIYLIVDETRIPPVDAVSLPVVEGDAFSNGGDVIGGVLLFARDGMLDNLEVYSLADEPLPLPSRDRVRVRRYRDDGSTP